MPRLNVQSSTARTNVIDGHEYVAYGGCNYLGFSRHPEIVRAITDTLNGRGISSSASRETTGDTDIHQNLEHVAASFLGFESALLSPEGYTANLIAFFAAAQDPEQPRQVAVIDRLSHASVHDSAKAAGLEVHLYADHDADAAAELVREHADRGVVLATDGVFPSEGVLAPLQQLLTDLPKSALLIVDDCHGLGVVGPGGRGSLAAVGLAGAGAEPDPRLVFTSTLAKAMGCYGGVVAWNERLQMVARTFATPYICTTPPPPPLAAGVTKAFEVLSREPERVARLHELGAKLGPGLAELGVENATDRPAPVWIFELPAEPAAKLHEFLKDRGIWLPLIRYPSGPGATPEPYFRLSLTSEHTERDLDDLLAGLRDSGVFAG